LIDRAKNGVEKAFGLCFIGPLPSVLPGKVPAGKLGYIRGNEIIIKKGLHREHALRTLCHELIHWIFPDYPEGEVEKMDMKAYLETS